MKENETKNYNKIAYNNAYNKEKYKNMNLRVKPDIFDYITTFCQDMDISRAEFVQLACLYVIDNDLFGEIVQNKD